MAGRAKENLPGGSLKYLFVYLKVRIFKCSYRSYVSLPEGSPVYIDSLLMWVKQCHKPPMTGNCS